MYSRNIITKLLLILIITTSIAIANNDYSKPVKIPSDNNSTINITGYISISMQG